ncbi:MAG: SCP2 sterol-binding domain-containing protein [Gammaproteobacteria bacterium]|nr:SCP2 sterol-binding domain-containing protein [Gammaproteobacteria bacterium]
MILNAFLPPAAALLNRGIRSSAEAAELCAELADRSLVTRIDGLPSGAWAMRISAIEGHLEILPESADSGQPADASIAGTPLELRRLMFSDREAPIRSGRVSFSGDIEVAERFRALITAARPDLERRLAAWVGEPAAFQLTNLARDVREWAIDSADELAFRATEYLQDDARHVPTHQEMNEFCAGVDDIANDVDRLEARLLRLAKDDRGGAERKA